jgi:hypothetical protein
VRVQKVDDLPHHEQVAAGERRLRLAQKPSDTLTCGVNNRGDVRPGSLIDHIDI